MGARRSAPVTPLAVDLDGMPRTWRLPATRWQPWLWGAYAALAATHVVLLLVGDRPVDRVEAGIAVVQVALGAGLAVLWKEMAVRLEPGGYRVGSAAWPGRLRSWSDVREVREAGPGTRHPEIRAGGSAADATPVRLAGMSAEQVLELRRRIDEARARERAARS